MKEKKYDDFTKTLSQKQRPIWGQIELSYSCPYHCLHCYADCFNKPQFRKNELKKSKWKNIIDQIEKEKGLYLTFTGGDPFTRSDFLEIYKYAKDKGFLITIFTNGFLINNKIINFLKKFPPFQIEITLNGLTKKTYEKITQKKNSFFKVMKIIKKIKKAKLPLVLKTNGMTLNKNEILKIKKFTDKLLGPKKFRYDSFILPGLLGDKKPLLYRLAPPEIIGIEKKDKDMREYRKEIFHHDVNLKAEKEKLYHCNSWLTSYFINPYGFLSFCHLSSKLGIDLKKEKFAYGFYRVFPRVSLFKFKTNSKCKNCSLRLQCFSCPARNELETGDEEKGSKYFCNLACAFAKEKEKVLIRARGSKPQSNSRSPESLVSDRMSDFRGEGQ